MTHDLREGDEGLGHQVFPDLLRRLFGTQRAKLVPATAIGEMAKAGAGFAGFATWLDMTPADPDMFADPRSRQPDPAAVEAGGRLARGRSVDERRAGRRRRRAIC